MLLMAVLLSISAQQEPIVLRHPRAQASYRATTEVPCGEDGTYVFVVANGVATSQLVTSTLNGVPIELRSDAASLRDAVARLKDVWLQPLSCIYGGGALVRVHGVDADSSSGTYGQSVTLGFQADLRSRPR